MNRRDFIAAMGLAAGALAVNDVPCPTDAAMAETWMATSLQPGDVFTIAGKYALNPVTRAPSAHLQRFLVTATVASG